MDHISDICCKTIPDYSYKLVPLEFKILDFKTFLNVLDDSLLSRYYSHIHFVDSLFIGI